MVHKSTAAACQSFADCRFELFKQELLRFLRSVGQGVGWGREEGIARLIAEKAMWMECREQVITWEGPKQRVRQGKGGGWNNGHDRGECAGRRPGLWTPSKEEQVEVKSEDMSRTTRGQSSAGRMAEGRTRQSAGRAGTNSAHGLWISRSLDEGKSGVIRSRRVGWRADIRVNLEL